MFPNLNPANMNRKQFNAALWEFYAEVSQKHYMQINNAKWSSYLNVYKNFLPQAGLSFEEIATSKTRQGSSAIQQLMEAVAEAQRHDTIFQGEGVAMQKFLREVATDTDLEKFQMPTGLTFNGGKTRIFRSVNADRVAAGLEPYGSMSDVPFSEWSKSLARRTKPTPPPLHGAMPSVSQVLWRGKDNMKADFEAVKVAYSRSYGKSLGTGEFLDESAISKWKEGAEANLNIIRAKAARIGSAERDFILHSYDKTYIERGLAFMSPFRYWTDHTKITMLESFAANPRMLSAYMHYRDFIEKEHADLPEFYRYNIPVSGFFGIDKENPLFFNLEANLNPLNSMTGVD